MMIIKANKNYEAGIPPSREFMDEMGKFNDDMLRAGVMLSGEGLQASSKGSRVKISNTNRTVTDGPFAETKELIAGFWIIRTESKEEAIDWAKRCPGPREEGSEIEIRQLSDV